MAAVGLRHGVLGLPERRPHRKSLLVEKDWRSICKSQLHIACCMLPVAGKNLFVEKDGGAMCKSCFAALHGAKCIVCGTNESKSPMHRNYWAQTLCRKHATETPTCAACSRVVIPGSCRHAACSMLSRHQVLARSIASVPSVSGVVISGSGGIDYDDGRVCCSECLKSAVNRNDQALDLFGEVWNIAYVLCGSQNSCDHNDHAPD